MEFVECVGNLHIHTTYSDGTADYGELAHIANRLGLDYLLVTDHNVYAGQHEGWYGRTLVLVGEEVNAKERGNENHLLVFGAGGDVSLWADDPQALIDAIKARGGHCVIAHPYERSGRFTREPEIDWVSWGVLGYDGLEIWNYMSEFKSYISSVVKTLLYVFFPKLAITGPYPETLARWDTLLAEGRMSAVGGSDSHGTTYRLGPLRRRVFSYDHLFRTVNTHLLVPQAWTGDALWDARLVYEALATGRSFIGYDGLAPTRGFSFTAENDGQVYTLGDEFLAHGAITLRVKAPQPAHLRLILNGFCIAEGWGTEFAHTSWAPGAYRVEALRPYAFKRRGWIYSNPIYVRTEQSASSVPIRR